MIIPFLLFAGYYNIVDGKCQEEKKTPFPHFASWNMISATSSIDNSKKINYNYIPEHAHRHIVIQIVS